MTPTLFILISAVIPLILDQFSQLPKGHKRQRSPLYYLLTPLIGIGAGLGLLAHIPFPFYSLFLLVTACLVLVIVSNLKLKILRMVYAAQDIENIRHFFIYPSFYLSHLNKFWLTLGALLFLGLSTGLVIASEYWTLIPITPSRWINLGLGIVVWWTLYLTITYIISRFLTNNTCLAIGLTQDPNIDICRFGLFGTILLHSLMQRDRKKLENLTKEHRRSVQAPDQKPHMVAIQGESFFDLRRFDSLVNGHSHFPELERLIDRGAFCHRLDVPSWGAYTMQTEMAFLTGIDPDAYGASKINPYRALAAQTEIWSIARQLKEVGYHTICIHPARPGFFRRHKVIPNMGFDEFLSIDAFMGSDNYGPYVSDEALGHKIQALLSSATQPLFIHAITIESHGPWEMGRFGDPELENNLLSTEPSSDLSFALYRQHMRNLLAALDRLSTQRYGDRSAYFALYGDHMPAHGDLFERHGFDDIAVDYLLCSSKGAAHSGKNPGPLNVENLGQEFLRHAGFKI